MSKKVLITGATGAIGSALVPHFLREEETRVVLLLRAESPWRLHERLARLFAFWELDPDGRLAARVEALAGDVAAPRLGLEEGTYRRLCGDVTHIVHAAGNVKLNQPLADAGRTTLAATQHVVALADAAQRHGPFRKLDLVSTVGVAGRTHGLIPEQPLLRPRTFRNSYEAAKARAEAWLFTQAPAGLPLTVHRPSMVVGDSQTGRVIHFQVFYYLCHFLAGKRTRGLVPEPGNVKLDLIPIDYVAAAIHQASNRSDAAGRVFHLCSGPTHSPTLATLMVRLRALLQARGERLPRLKFLPPRWLGRLFNLGSCFASARMRRALQALPFFLAYLDDEQEFDNAQSRAFFAAGGLELSPVEQYLGRVLDYYWDAKAMRRVLSAPGR
jgi:thioester reductase-like protein